MRRAWSFWLVCLLLAALPFKGLAAMGAGGCCPPTATVAAGDVAPAGHPAHHAHAATPAADGHAASAGELPHPGHDGAGHGVAKLSPCCAAVAVGAPPVWRAPSAPMSAAPLWRDRPYRSAWLPGLERPPRA